MPVPSLLIKAASAVTHNLILCKPSPKQKGLGLHKSGYVHRLAFGGPSGSRAFRARP